MSQQLILKLQCAVRWFGALSCVVGRHIWCGTASACWTAVAMTLSVTSLRMHNLGQVQGDQCPNLLNTSTASVTMNTTSASGQLQRVNKLKVKWHVSNSDLPNRTWLLRSCKCTRNWHGTWLIVCFSQEASQGRQDDADQQQTARPAKNAGA